MPRRAGTAFASSPRETAWRRAYSSLLFASMWFLGCEAREQTTSPRSDEAVFDPGCPHRDGAACVHQDSPARAEKTSEVQIYGEPFGHAAWKETPLSAILADPQRFHDQEVLVSGHVQRACSRRGCWMEVAPQAGEDRGCRVTFKDYGFLVPTHSQGSEARLLGVVQVTVLPKSAVEHYESEGGTFKNKQPDGTAREVRIVASGVELSSPS